MGIYPFGRIEVGAGVCALVDAYSRPFFFFFFFRSDMTC